MIQGKMNSFSYPCIPDISLPFPKGTCYTLLCVLPKIFYAFISIYQKIIFYTEVYYTHCRAPCFFFTNNLDILKYLYT